MTAKWWPIVKLLLAVAILAAIGWRFADMLGKLRGQDLTVRWHWLAAGGLIYLIGLLFWGTFWQRLLVSVGEAPSPTATLRAYFMGHLGKYVPGKAWGLLLRTGMMYEVGVRPGVAALTATYETLTTMAAGVLLAAVLLVGLDVNLGGEIPWFWTTVILLLIVVIPIVPGVFNPLMQVVGLLADRAAKKFGSTEVAPLPQVGFGIFRVGLLLTAIGWAWLGLSCWCVMQALTPGGLDFDLPLWGRCTAFVALAWVAGFLAVVTPGGLGVREYLLQTALAQELAAGAEAAPLAVVIVLVLRLLWTVMEVMMAAVAYWLPVTRAGAVPAPTPLAENQPS